MNDSAKLSARCDTDAWRREFQRLLARCSAIEVAVIRPRRQLQPARVIRLDPCTNRTYHYWHVFVPAVQPGQIYAYRVDGPFRPGQGSSIRCIQRFSSIRTDAASLSRKTTAAEAASRAGDNAASAMKSMVVDPHAYNWEDDRPLRQAVVANHHLRNACARFHPASQFRSCRGEARHLCRAHREDSLPAGTWELPQSNFFPYSNSMPRTARRGLVNYWGYAPVSFFSPHQAYSSRHDRIGPGG